MMEEIPTLMMWAGISIPVWQLQVIAFDLANHALKQVEKFLNRLYLVCFTSSARQNV